MKTQMALIATLLIPLAAGPLAAGEAPLPSPTSEAAWTHALARPEYKGPDPCAQHSKGVCVADNYRPRAQALARFRTDADAIDPQYNPALDELGRALQKGLADAVLNIHGHADSTGGEDHNLALSQRRAAAVRAYLMERFGIEPERLTPVAHGEAAPVADNATEEGRRQNRRVEFERVGLWIR